MIVIIGILVILFLFSKSGGVATMAAATTPVNLNSTGASLSNALGNTGAPPSAFGTGKITTAPTIVNQQPIGSSVPAASPVVSGGVQAQNHATNPIRYGTSFVNNPNNAPVVLPKFIGAQPVSARVNPVSQIVRGAPNVPVPGPNNPSGTYSPQLANRPVSFARNSPEATSTFFAKTNVPLIIQSKIKR
jgi:hypothetical protein